MTNILRCSYAPAFFLVFIGAGVVLVMADAPGDARARAAHRDRDLARISYLAQMVQPFRDLAAMYGGKPAAGQAIEPDMTNVIAFP